MTTTIYHTVAADDPCLERNPEDRSVAGLRTCADDGQTIAAAYLVDDTVRVYQADRPRSTADEMRFHTLLIQMDRVATGR